MSAFASDLDIINRALPILRKRRIASRTDHSDSAREMVAAYDRVRVAELEQNLWVFATRRVRLFALNTDTLFWTPPAYAAVTTYPLGYIVSYNDVYWQSQVASNQGNTPSATSTAWRRYSGPLTAQPWDDDTVYYAGDLVEDGGDVFLSIVNANEDDTAEAASWLPLDGTTASSPILYPVALGASMRGPAYAYALPYGWLRECPQQPRFPGSVNGLFGGHIRDDLVYENGYVLSCGPGPLLFRYVTDADYVPAMPALFCEVVAAKLAEETGPLIVENTESLPNLANMLLANARRLYREKRRAATMANAIEVGPIDPDLEDFIAVRY